MDESFYDEIIEDSGNRLFDEEGEGKTPSELSDLLATVEQYFKNCRYNKYVHLGLGDIRLTIGMQEEVLKMIAEATGQEFNEIR